MGKSTEVKGHVPYVEDLLRRSWDARNNDVDLYFGILQKYFDIYEHIDINTISKLKMWMRNTPPGSITRARRKIMEEAEKKGDFDVLSEKRIIKLRQKAAEDMRRNMPGPLEPTTH